MQMTRTLRAPSDRTLNRLIAGLVIALAIGGALIGALYFLDQHRDPGPSLVDRQIATLEEAVRQSPNSVNARLQLGGAYLAGQRYADAIAQYDAVLKADAGNIAATLGRADVRLETKDLDGATADYSAVITARKDTEFAGVDTYLERAYYGLGTIQFDRGQASDAIASLKGALKINGADADALNLIGKAYLQANDPTDALGSFEDAITLVPTGWDEPYSGLSSAARALGDADEAQFGSAMAAWIQGRTTEARNGLLAIVDGKAGARAMLGLGLMSESAGSVSEAADWYRKVLALDPGNFNAQNGLNRVTAQLATPPAAGASPAPTGGE